MSSINMISPRRAEKRRLEVNVRKLLLVIIAEAVLVVGVMGLLMSRIWATNSRITDLQVKITELQPTVHKIEYYEKAIGELKPKLDTLGRARTDTERWRRVLDDLSISLPQKTWLTRIAAVAPSNPTSPEMVVNLNGISASQELVGETMLRIQRSVPDFDHLDLHYTQKSTAGSQSAVEFEVAGAIKLVEEKDIKEVDKS